MVLSMSDARKHARYAFAWDQSASRERSRQELYADLEGYYLNSIWAERTKDLLRSMAGWADTATVEGLYNPIKTIVDFYRDYTLAGRLVEEPDEDDPEATATILTDNPRLVEPILDIARWSAWEERKSLIGLWGANLGNALLVVVDEANTNTPARSKVWIEVRHPAELVDWDVDSRGNLTLARLAERREERDATGRRIPYLFERLFTKSHYATYRDGQPYEYRRQPDGRPVERLSGTNPATGHAWQVGEWPNPHGFVPVRVIRHEDDGGVWGLNAWYHLIPPVDELNRRASHFGDIIGQHMAAQWAILGAQPPATSNANGATTEDDLDRGAVLYLPDGSDIKAVVAPINIGDAYTHVTQLLAWIREISPELMLTELMRRGGDISGVAVHNMLRPLIKRAERAQAAYTAEWIRAVQMALTMGRNVGGTGINLWQQRYQADVGEYEANQLDFRVRWADILPLDPLSEIEIAQARKGLSSPPPAPPVVATVTTSQASAESVPPVPSRNGTAPHPPSR